MDLASENPKQRRISVSAITTREWDFAADVAGYKAAGLDAIGVWRNKLEAVGVTNGEMTVTIQPMSREEQTALLQRIRTPEPVHVDPAAPRVSR